MGKQYINSNGEIVEGKSKVVSATNRAYLYGDGLFESIRIINGKAINIEAHILRMLDGAIALKMRIPSYFTVDFFTNKINDLIQQSEIFNGGRVRISLDRVSGGTYKPESNEVTYLIEVSPMEQPVFELNNRGWEVDLYTEIRKHKSKISNFKTKNGLLYVMAGIAAQEQELDDLLITNSKGGILEGSSSNLFVVSNGLLYTPGLDEGCLAGVMRMTIINLALEVGIKVYECSIMPQNLLIADEVFLTNAIHGIIWVSGYRTKRYQNNVSSHLLDLLNQKYS